MGKPEIIVFVCLCWVASVVVAPVSAAQHDLPPVAGWQLTKYQGDHCSISKTDLARNTIGLSWYGDGRVKATVFWTNIPMDIARNRDRGTSQLNVNGFVYDGLEMATNNGFASPQSFEFATREAIATDFSVGEMAIFFVNGKQTMSFSLKGSTAAVAALRRCASDGAAPSPRAKLTASKVVETASGTSDQETIAASRATPRTSPASWVTVNDYPIRAALAGESGVSSFRLSIDQSGRPTQCSITSSSGSGLLDKQTCTLLLRRAIFQPARSAEGQRLEDTFSSRIRWVSIDVPEYVDHVAERYASEPAYRLEVDSSYRAICNSSVKDLRVCNRVMQVVYEGK